MVSKWIKGATELEALQLLAELYEYPRESRLVGTVLFDRSSLTPTPTPDPDPRVRELGWTKLSVRWDDSGAEITSRCEEDVVANVVGLRPEKIARLQQLIATAAAGPKAIVTGDNV